MSIMSGWEIINLHNNHQNTIRELEEAMPLLEEFSYAQAVIQANLAKVQEELRKLEQTRFQELEPVTVVNSSLGGHVSYPS